MLGRAPSLSVLPTLTQRTQLHPAPTLEPHPAEGVELWQQERQQLRLRLFHASTKQSAPWAPLFLPLMQLHKM